MRQIPPTRRDIPPPPPPTRPSPSVSAAHFENPMRKFALVLSLVAAFPAVVVALELFGTGMSRAFFGATNVCAAGGPECHVPVSEPRDFIGFLPLALPFVIIAIASVAGGIVTLGRPWAGAVILFTVGVLGAVTILLFIPPIWTLLDLGAGVLAVLAARQHVSAADPQGGSPH